MKFRPGQFQPHRAPRIARPFCPIAAYHALHEIPLSAMHENGKRLLLLDVDNTLVRWKAEVFDQEVLDWIAEAKALGFQLCLLSNARRLPRLMRISENLDIPFLRDRFKPSRRMYLQALAKFNARPEETVMIGDQLLTDILGANRAGVEAIWVHRISPHEFIGTRLGNRVLELFVIGFLSQALPVVAKLPDPTGAPEETSLALQFFRFLVVGASSFVVDTGIYAGLHDHTKLHGQTLGMIAGLAIQRNWPWLVAGWAKNAPAASVPVFKIVSTAAGICNGFYWNRRWTFGITDTAARANQFRRFVAVNVVGASLNILIVTILIDTVALTGDVRTLFCQAVAAAIVAVWR